MSIIPGVAAIRQTGVTYKQDAACGVAGPSPVSIEFFYLFSIFLYFFDMKKSCKITLGAVILLVLAAGAAAIFTCPKIEDHKTVLNEKTKVYLDKKYPTPEGQAIPNFKYIIAGKILEVYYDKNLSVKNCLFFSKAVLTVEEGEKTVSTGVFGKIFLSDNKAKEIVETIQADKTVFPDTDEKGRPITPAKKKLNTLDTKKEPDKLLQLK